MASPTPVLVRRRAESCVALEPGTTLLLRKETFTVVEGKFMVAPPGYLKTVVLRAAAAGAPR